MKVSVGVPGPFSRVTHGLIQANNDKDKFVELSEMLETEKGDMNLSHPVTVPGISSHTIHAHGQLLRRIRVMKPDMSYFRKHRFAIFFFRRDIFVFLP